MRNTDILPEISSYDSENWTVKDQQQFSLKNHLRVRATEEVTQDNQGIPKE